MARPSVITSYADTSGTTIKNQIAYTYQDNLGVKTSAQDHNGVVNGSTPVVTYDYDLSAVSGVFDDGMRLYRTTNPSGKHVEASFTGSFNDALNRVSGLSGDHTGSVVNLTSYEYSGTGQLAKVTYPGPATSLLRDEGNDGTYEHLDRFGRIKKQVWKSGTTVKDQVDYTYDAAGNRLTRDIPVSGNTQDQAIPTMVFGASGPMMKGFWQELVSAEFQRRSKTIAWTFWVTGLTSPRGPWRWESAS